MMLEFIRTILMLLVGITIMFTLNKVLTLITAIMVIPVIVTSIAFHKNHKADKRAGDGRGQLFTVIQENLTEPRCKGFRQAGLRVGEIRRAK